MKLNISTEREQIINIFKFFIADFADVNITLFVFFI